MSTRILRVILYLYPRNFRDRFGDEWIELAKRRIGKGSERRRVGIGTWWPVVRDAVRAIPVAYGILIVDGARRLGSRVYRTFHRSSIINAQHRQSLHTPGPDPFLGSTGSDIRHAVRSLLRNPRFTIAAVVSVRQC